MGNWNLGGDTPFDPSLDVGDVSSLQSLEAQRTPVPATTPAQTTPKSDVESGDPQRELLARVLMSLGSIGGHQPPAFLTQELSQRAIDRRQDKTIQAAQQRQFANQQAIEQRQQAADARKQAGIDTKNQAMGQAATDVNEFAIRTGIEAFDQRTRLAAENRLIFAGWKPEDARKHVQGIGTKWELSKDQSGFIQTDANTGQPTGVEIPRVIVEHVGGALVTRRGTQVTSTFTPPKDVTINPENQQILRVPASTENVGGAAPSGVPAPTPGTIQPTGGGLLNIGGVIPPGTNPSDASNDAARQAFLATLTGGGNPGGAPQPLTPAPAPRGVSLTPEDARLLAGTKFNKVKSYGDLGTEGSEVLQTARQDEQYRVADQQAQMANQKYFTQLDAREQAKVKFAQDKADKAFASAETSLNQLEDLAPKLQKKGLVPTGTGGGASWLAAVRRSSIPLVGTPNDPDLRQWEFHSGTMVSVLRALGDIGPRAKSAYESAQQLVTNPPPAAGMKKALDQLREMIKAAKTGEVQHVGLPGTTGDPTVPPTLRPTTPGIPLPGGRQSNDRAFGDR